MFPSPARILLRAATLGLALTACDEPTTSVKPSLIKRPSQPGGSGDEVRPPRRQRPRELPLRLMHLDMSDGTGQAVHPDVAVAADVFGAMYRLVVTSYPLSDAKQEYPEIFHGTTGANFHQVPGVANPLFTQRDSPGTLSDPDWLYEPERGEMWLYYRVVADANIIVLSRSADGVSWSAPVEVVRAPNHELVSPAVVRRGPGDWMMWSVNAGREGCRSVSTSVEQRTSTDGITWSAPTTVRLTQPGFSVWHIDVTWVPEFQEYWAIYPVKARGNCVPPAVYLAVSEDGITWRTSAAPLLERGVLPAFQDLVYRSSILYQPATDMVFLWYSGARFTANGYLWSTAVQRRRRESLFPLATVPVPGAVLPQPAQGLPPPEP